MLRYISIDLEMYLSKFCETYFSTSVTKQGLWGWAAITQYSGLLLSKPNPLLPPTRALNWISHPPWKCIFLLSWNLWIQQFWQICSSLKFTFLHSSTLNPAILEIPPSSMLVHFDGFVNAPVWDNMHFSNIQIPLSRSRRICTKKNVREEKKRKFKKNIIWGGHPPTFM